MQKNSTTQTTNIQINTFTQTISMQTNSTTQTTDNKINNFTQTISIQHDKQTETSILLQNNSSQTRIQNQNNSTQTENEKGQLPAIENKNKEENNNSNHNITLSTNLDDFNRYFDLEQLSVQSSSQSSDMQKPKKKKSGWRKLKKTVSKFTKSVKSKTKQQ
ncbi:hypothetical protein TNIN_286341 [Trichonephila inaurata madagascariensis]|uniref:Uncharacterized protein n=1 Tax=Trichonephila inaurata madagascariensis TaxID=2747483 RepID=A0A8X6XJ00_9ARAC|nr:hypothetical protein TNIN_286341 [Trichonephila inaurata madagascariensis]